nr:hypothetical protein [Tanacetum cinerariifolium]
KQAHVEFEVKKDSSLEANQDHAEFVPRYGLEIECNQPRIVFVHDLGSESSSQDDYHKWELLDDNFMGSSQVEAKRERDPNQMDTTMKILEWNMKAPLEIIYEAYEGEEEEDEENNDNNMETRESVFFKWEEEEDDDREELIEISLDHYGKISIEFSHTDEDNLIEIDISTTRN